MSHRLRIFSGAVFGALIWIGATGFIFKVRALSHLPPGQTYSLLFPMALLAAIGLVGLRFKEPLRTLGSVVVIGTVLLLFLAEASLLLKQEIRMVLFRRNPALRFVSFARQSGTPFDTRNWNEVVADLRRQGVPAYPFISPASFLGPDGTGLALPGGNKVIPLGGISRVVSVYGNENGEYVVYTSDEFGFNNPSGLYQQGQVQVALLGDSFAQGCCVPSEKNTAAIVRSRFPRTLNLGVSDNGPLREYASLREYLPALKPASVVWLFYSEDMERMSRELENPILRHYLAPGFHQDLGRLQKQIDSSLKAYAQQKLSSAEHRPSVLAEAIQSIDKQELYSLIKLKTVREALGLLPYFRPPEPYAGNDSLRAAFDQLVRQAKSEVDGWGGKLYFAYLPAWNRFSEPYYHDPYREHVIEVLKENQVSLLDFEARMADDPDPMRYFPFRQRGHYTEAGHRLLGELIVKALDSGGR